MKGISKAAVLLVIILGAGLMLQSCASSRSHCDCNDLTKNYRAPKSYKRNVN
jgi:hypothetical protein